MAAITLDGVRKEFANGAVAVDDGALELGDGKSIVLVGPPGCSRSTLPRLIAGLEEATAGRIAIGGRHVTEPPPGQRDVAMVFQSHALDPHTSVHQNLGYGLRCAGRGSTRSRSASARSRRCSGSRSSSTGGRPSSPGQRLRVAMGSAIAREPQAFESAELAPELPAIAQLAEVVEELGADVHVLLRVEAPPITAESPERGHEEASLLPEERALYTARADPRTRLRTGQPVPLAVDPSRFYVFDPETASSLVAGAPALVPLAVG